MYDGRVQFGKAAFAQNKPATVRREKEIQCPVNWQIDFEV